MSLTLLSSLKWTHIAHFISKLKQSGVICYLLYVLIISLIYILHAVAYNLFTHSLFRTFQTGALTEDVFPFPETTLRSGFLRAGSQQPHAKGQRFCLLPASHTTQLFHLYFTPPPPSTPTFPICALLSHIRSVSVRNQNMSNWRLVSLIFLLTLSSVKGFVPSSSSSSSSSPAIVNNWVHLWFIPSGFF